MPGCHLSDLPAVRECKGDVLNQNGLAPGRRHKHPGQDRPAKRSTLTPNFSADRIAAARLSLADRDCRRVSAAFPSALEGQPSGLRYA
jgi:hypothetical protein